jgi:hypothetical protein
VAFTGTLEGMAYSLENEFVVAALAALYKHVNG